MAFNCGPLFLTGISGTELSTPEMNFIKDNNLSGVVLFSKNYKSKKQVSDLISQIQELAPVKKIIAVDHEGGRVQRFKDDFTIIPSAKEIAETNSPSKCFEIYSQIAEELSSVGVNLNFAPCADILTNPKCSVIGDRSFGREVEVVSKFISASIRGLQKNGVMACVKHFPGHGDTFVDSHDDLPKSERSFTQLESEDIDVFKVGFKNKVSSVMMAHLLIPDFDSDLPFSLSKKAHDYVKNTLSFDGLIISDDMEMGAITKNFGAVESAEMAISAGTHLVEYRSFEACRDVLDALNKKCSTSSSLQNLVNSRIKELSVRLNKFIS